MAYHIEQIDKGVYGEFSKIREEFQELNDAYKQQDKILQICEMSDLIGAIGAYASRFNLTLEDLVSFSKKTEEAFIEGMR